MQQKNIREGIFFFPGYILKQLGIALSIFSTHNMGAETEDLCKLVSVQKENFLKSIKIDRGRHLFFCLRLAYVCSTFLVNKEISMNSKQKSDQKLLE